MREEVLEFKEEEADNLNQDPSTHSCEQIFPHLRGSYFTQEFHGSNATFRTANIK